MQLNMKAELLDKQGNLTRYTPEELRAYKIKHNENTPNPNDHWNIDSDSTVDLDHRAEDHLKAWKEATRSAAVTQTITHNEQIEENVLSSILSKIVENHNKSKNVTVPVHAFYTTQLHIPRVQVAPGVFFGGEHCDLQHFLTLAVKSGELTTLPKNKDELADQIIVMPYRSPTTGTGGHFQALMIMIDNQNDMVHAVFANPLGGESFPAVLKADLENCFGEKKVQTYVHNEKIQSDWINCGPLSVYILSKWMRLDYNKFVSDQNYLSEAFRSKAFSLDSAALNSQSNSNLLMRLWLLNEGNQLKWADKNIWKAVEKELSDFIKNNHLNYLKDALKTLINEDDEELRLSAIEKIREIILPCMMQKKYQFRVPTPSFSNVALKAILLGLIAASIMSYMIGATLLVAAISFAVGAVTSIVAGALRHYLRQEAARINTPEEAKTPANTHAQRDAFQLGFNAVTNKKGIGSRTYNYLESFFRTNWKDYYCGELAAELDNEMKKTTKTSLKK